MKKLVSLLMTLAVVVSVMGFATTKASAAEEYFTYAGVEGNAFIFDATHGSNLNNSSIFVGSEYHTLYCVFKKDDSKIVCDAGSVITNFAGQMGIIYLAGQVFWVKIPEKESKTEVYNTPTCIQPDVIGAMVLFISVEGNYGPYFISGDTLQAVENNAFDWLGQFYIDFIIQSGLECGQEPT